jgi:hypothetical protein
MNNRGDQEYADVPADEKRTAQGVVRTMTYQPKASSAA